MVVRTDSSAITSVLDSDIADSLPILLHSDYLKRVNFISNLRALYSFEMMPRRMCFVL